MPTVQSKGFKDFQNISLERLPSSKVLREIEQVTPTPTGIQRLGETSSGKEVIAAHDLCDEPTPPPPFRQSKLPRFRQDCWKASSLDMKNAPSPEPTAHEAASILGLKRTTLQCKMKKLEIPRY